MADIKQFGDEYKVLNDRLAYIGAARIQGKPTTLYAHYDGGLVSLRDDRNPHQGQTIGTPMNAEVLGRRLETLRASEDPDHVALAKKLEPVHKKIGGHSGLAQKQNDQSGPAALGQGA